MYQAIYNAQEAGYLAFVSIHIIGCGNLKTIFKKIVQIFIIFV